MTEIKPSKQKALEISSYWGVISAASIIWLTPVLLLGFLLPQPNLSSPGILRPEPGQTILTIPMARNNPENDGVIATETLNGEVAKQALRTPSITPLLKTADSSRIGSILLQNPEVEDAQKLNEYLEASSKAGAEWSPNAGPWGLFLLPKDKPPTSKMMPYGLVEITEGSELTRITSEKNLNRKLFELRTQQGNQREPNSRWELLQASVGEGIISPEEALKTLAGAQILQIEYMPEKKLFFSPQTALNWKKTSIEIDNLSENNDN